MNKRIVVALIAGALCTAIYANISLKALKNLATELQLYKAKQELRLLQKYNTALMHQYHLQQQQLKKQDELSKITKLSEKQPQWYRELPLKPEYQQFLYETCNAYEIDYEVALAVIRLETEGTYDPTFVTEGENGRGQGLFQIFTLWEDWYAELAGLSTYDVFDPYDNIRMGVAGLAFYQAYWVQQGITSDELTICTLNSYNAGLRSFERYIHKTGSIHRGYSNNIMRYKEEIAP